MARRTRAAFGKVEGLGEVRLLRRSYRAILKLVQARNPPVTITIQKLNITVPPDAFQQQHDAPPAGRRNARKSGGRRETPGSKKVAEEAQTPGRFTCPLCEHSADEFEAFGVNPRPDARCPKCGSLERTRLLWLALTRMSVVGKDTMRLLHVAPEPTLQAALKSNDHITYVSADLSKHRADVIADLTKGTPFRDHTFDAVVCSHVLEHVDDDRVALREIGRVLATDGKAFLMVPMDSRLDRTIEDPTVTDPEERLRLFGQTDHVRRYGRDFEQRLSDAGFEYDVVTAETLLSKDEALRFRCDKGSAGYLHVARKATPPVDGFDQAAFWRERHESLEGDPRSVGNLLLSVEENLAAEQTLRKVVDRAATLLKPAETVLDLGCGFGRTAESFINQGYAYLGVDVSPTAVRQAEERVSGGQFVVGDLSAWDTEQTFDVVCALYVFVHFVDDGSWESLLERAMKWVRPGGSLLIADHFSSEREQPARHVVTRPLSDYLSLMKAHGFSLGEQFHNDLRRQGDLELRGAEHFHLFRKQADSGG